MYMKYLKLFESTIKHSDPIAENNILRNFSRKVEDVVIDIKNFDNFNGTTVRRYFHDDGSIHINYRSFARGKALKIKMYSDRVNEVRMDVYCYKKYDRDEINTSLEFYNYLKDTMKEYIVRDDSLSLDFNFPFSELNNILEILESFTAAKKYNL